MQLVLCSQISMRLLSEVNLAQLVFCWLETTRPVFASLLILHPNKTKKVSLRRQRQIVGELLLPNEKSSLQHEQ